MTALHNFTFRKEIGLTGRVVRPIVKFRNVVDRC